MTLEQEVEKFFQTNTKFYSIYDVQKKLGLRSNQKESLQTILTKLESQGKIYYDNGKYIHVPSDFYLRFGTLKMSQKKNYYIKTFAKEIILIPKENVLKTDAHLGDKVFVELLPKEKGVQENIGVIRRVVQAATLCEANFLKTTLLIDKLHRYYIMMENKPIYLKPHDLNGAFAGDEVSIYTEKKDGHNAFKVVEVIKQKEKYRIFVKKNQSWYSTENHLYKASLNETDFYLDGTKILALYEYDKKTKTFSISCKKVITENIEEWIREYAAEHGFKASFSEESLKECSFITKMKQKEERADLRDLQVISIDPENAKDLDDAISLEKKKNGYRLYVHIADVDFFVPFSSSLFQEAIHRGTSCYLGNIVIPQLPEVLSNHVCSLKEKEERLTKTMMIDVDYNGDIIDFQIFRSVICNQKQMTYEKADLFLEQGLIEQDYQPFQKMLLEMNELSAILQTRRMKRGYLPLNVLELQAVINQNHIVSKLLETKNGPAHRMIENFMLLANEAVTDYFYWLNLPFVYRNHDSPSLSKLYRLKKELASLQYKTRGIKELQIQKKYQQYLTTICRGCSENEQKYIMTLFLQSLEKAYYSNENIGHFGLALKRYGTVTSPIRRGCDLVNHAVMSEFLTNGLTSSKLDEIKEFISQNVERLNTQELASEELEKDIKKYLLEEYAHQFIDEVFDATIEFITEKEVFIRTTNNILGMIPILGEDRVDRFHHTYISGNQTYRAKDTIKVRLTSATLTKNAYCVFSKENNLNLKRNL